MVSNQRAGLGQSPLHKVVLFLHIPKTAGSSIISCGVKSSGHKRLRDCDHDSDTVFAVVRNPYDRAVSTYYFIKQCHLNRGSYCPTQDHDVNAWWSRVYSHAHRLLNCSRPFCYYERQLEFINDYKGGGVSNRITDILRYENLDADWGAFAGKHNLVSLPHKNKSGLRPDSHWSEELNADSITMIGELYADDFEHLGYELF